MEPRLAYAHCGPKDDLELQILRPCTSWNTKIQAQVTPRLRCAALVIEPRAYRLSQ